MHDKTSKYHNEPPLPDSEDYPYYSGKAYGFPLPFVSVGQEGCFDQRHATVEWHPEMLLLDVVVFAVPGLIFYWLLSVLYRRVRKQGGGKTT